MKIIRSWADVPITLDTELAAQILMMDENTIRTKLRNGEIPGKKVSTRKWVIEKNQLMEYLGVTVSSNVTENCNNSLGGAGNGKISQGSY